MRVLLALALTAAAPAVPAGSQRAIRHQIPRLAYAPARVPTGFRYSSWETTARPLLRITFRNAAMQEIVFTASYRSGDCTAGKEKTLQLDGSKIYWSQTPAGQRAWRCVRAANGRQVQLATAIALPPTKFGPSGIGIVTAAGRLIRP